MTAKCHARVRAGGEHESRLQHFREQNKRDVSRWGEGRLDNVAVPSAEVLERLLRTETATERALNRAIDRLERLQRRRVGEFGGETDLTAQPLSPDLEHRDLCLRRCSSSCFLGCLSPQQSWRSSSCCRSPLWCLCTACLCSAWG